MIFCKYQHAVPLYYPAPRGRDMDDLSRLPCVVLEILRRYSFSNILENDPPSMPGDATPSPPSSCPSSTSRWPRSSRDAGSEMPAASPGSGGAESEAG